MNWEPFKTALQPSSTDRAVLQLPVRHQGLANQVLSVDSGIGSPFPSVRMPLTGMADPTHLLSSQLSQNNAVVLGGVNLA